MTTSARRNSGRRGANAVPRILIVEDEPAVRFSLRVASEREGWQTVEATTGEQALAAVRRQRPDLVLLDIMLPDMSGLDVCRQIRLEDRLVPIIMVSARGDEVDKIVGLELGADDYVTKPFSVRELVARVRAGLRRAAAESEHRTAPSAASGTAADADADEPADRLVFGALEVLPAERRVLVGGQEVALTRTEFDLLLALAESKGRVLTRDALVAAVWGYDSEGGTRLLDSHILHLRGKIEPDPRRPRFVLTVRDVGYRLNRRPS